MHESIEQREKFIRDTLQVMLEYSSACLYVIDLARILKSRGYDEATSVRNIWMMLDNGFLGFKNDMSLKLYGPGGYY